MRYSGISLIKNVRSACAHDRYRTSLKVKHSQAQEIPDNIGRNASTFLTFRFPFIDILFSSKGKTGIALTGRAESGSLTICGLRGQIARVERKCVSPRTYRSVHNGCSISKCGRSVFIAVTGERCARLSSVP
jgi:hypothetical protein